MGVKWEQAMEARHYKSKNPIQLREYKNKGDLPKSNTLPQLNIATITQDEISKKSNAYHLAIPEEVN